MHIGSVAVFSEAVVQQELISFISKFNVLEPAEIEEMAAHIHAKAFTKGSVLLREGKKTASCFFVLKGLLRQYHITDGIEKTTRFFEEEEAAVLFTEYMSQTASNSTLVCAEDSILIIGSPEEEGAMYEQFPKLQQITRLMVERDLAKTQDALTRFISLSPIERYEYLLKEKPSLVQRAPQHQLASYIGITPESLSRIRKRMTDTSR
jgi:CRP-like cAMP-binding protein